MVSYCCHIGCSEKAEFELQTVRAISSLPYVGIAGPDPYADDTQACEQHVGVLLGYQPDAIESKDIYWQVRVLENA